MAQSKVLDTYKMVAELLNSGSESNIEKAYSALLAATDQKYQSRLSDIATDYAEKRDTAARSKAAGDRYLNYFMAERGYGGSGIEADAKVKNELSYRSGLSALSGEENKAKDAARQSRDEETLKLESQKYKDRAAEENTLYERIYQASKDEADEAYRQKQLEMQEAAAKNDAYWKQKSYELEKEKISKSAEASAAKNYQNAIYDYLSDKAAKATTEYQLEQIFEALTGSWSAEAQNMLGSSGYSKLLQYVRKRMGEIAANDPNSEKVEALYQTLKNTKG